MKSNLSFRNLLIGLVIVVVLAMIILRGDQLVELAETIRQGSVLPLVAAIATQLVKYFLQSVAYTHTFAAVGECYAIRNTLPLVFGTFFMNTIAPSANLAGITLVVDDARRRGIDPGRAGSAALLMQITIDSGFGVIIVIGFSVLALTVGLPIGWFLLGLIDVVAVSAMISILVLGRKRPDLLAKVLAFAERLVNRVLSVFKRGPVKPFAERTASSFCEAAGLIAANPKPTARAFACSIGASVCELACFVLVGVSFGVTSPEALVCGYVVATLFAMFSITPQGVGIVEAAVLVAFSTFGASQAAGLSIGLVYRGIVFWLPFLIGAVLIQATSTFKGGSGIDADATGVSDAAKDSPADAAGEEPDVQVDRRGPSGPGACADESAVCDAAPVVGTPAASASELEPAAGTEKSQSIESNAPDRRAASDGQVGQLARGGQAGSIAPTAQAGLVGRTGGAAASCAPLQDAGVFSVPVATPLQAHARIPAEAHRPAPESKPQPTNRVGVSPAGTEGFSLTELSPLSVNQASALLTIDWDQVEFAVSPLQGAQDALGPRVRKLPRFLLRRPNREAEGPLQSTADEGAAPAPEGAEPRSSLPGASK